MNTKSLSFGIVFPKIVSVTKTAVSAPKTKSVSKKALVMPRTTPVKLVLRGSFFKMLVPVGSIVSIAMIVSMIGFHLFAVNSYSGKGFELKRHQAAIAELTDQQKRLVVLQAEMGSIMKVSDAANRFGLMPIANEEYITSNQLTQR